MIVAPPARDAPPSARRPRSRPCPACWRRAARARTACRRRAAVGQRRRAPPRRCRRRVGFIRQRVSMLVEDAPVDVVVVDDQHRQARPAPGRSVRDWQRRRSRSVAVKWNVLPCARLALDPDPAAHQLHQRRRDRQAEAGAAEPPRRRSVGLAEGSKIVACLSGGMPMPVSLTAKCSCAAIAEPLVAADLHAARGRCSVNLIALPTRLVMTCRSRAGSPTMPAGTSAAMSAMQLEPLLVRPAAPAASACPRRDRASENGIASSSSLRDSIFEKSRMSLSIASSESAEDLTVVEALALLGGQRRCRAPARSSR